MAIYPSTYLVITDIVTVDMSRHDEFISRPAVLWSVNHTPCARARPIHARHHVRPHRRPRTRACTAARRAGGWAPRPAAPAFCSSWVPPPLHSFAGQKPPTVPPTVFTRSNPKGIFDRSDERPTQQQRTARARVPHRSGMDGWRPVMTR